MNSCRPWLGAAVNNYPGVTGLVARMQDHEARIGRALDVVHDYRTPGETLSADDQLLAQRASSNANGSTILMVNWKPAATWTDAAGGDATVNAQIDAMADSIKAVAPHRVMLAVFHEPENDVSPGGSPGCGSSVTYKGSAGTTADYVAMWHNVRARFDARGVTNVVWVMNYMGYSGWSCMVKDLWPGNDHVDWVVWDPYGGGGSGNTFVGLASGFYTWLEGHTDATHDFTSKPWGLNEWGAHTSLGQPQVYALYDDAKAALDAASLPRLKLYVVFDVVNGGDFRIEYDASGNLDATEQQHYAAFANDPRISGP